MLSITPGTNPVVRCPKIWCWSSFTPPVSSVIVFRGHRRQGRARAAGVFFLFFVASASYLPRGRAPSRAVRNLHTKYSYRKPAWRRSARLNANSGKRKRASVSETVLERTAATVALENRKTPRSIRLSFRRRQARVGFTTPPTNYHRRIVN